MFQTIRSYFSSPFILCTHENPDIDGVSSLLTLQLWMKKNGFTVKSIVQPPFPGVHYLNGFENVSEEITELYLSQKNVFVALDCANKDRIWPSSYVHSAQTIINIDHHIDNPRFGDVNFVDPTLSSTAEMMFRFLQQEEETIPIEWVENCYAGVLFDTGGFRYSNTKDSTFETARKCVQAGINPAKISQYVFQSWTTTTFTALRLALQCIHSYYKEQVLVSAIPYDDIKKNSLHRLDFEGLIDILRLHRSAKIVVLVREIEPGVWKGSIRSVNGLSILSLAHSLNGGGHMYAAGFTFTGNLDVIEEKIHSFIASASILIT